jgi:signal-transduction protein with cAMP-binding, CBS, and nucleotidyltransferase domain
MITIQELKSFKLFDGLSDEDLNRLAAIAQQRSHEKGTICFQQGTPASELHLCRSGQVDIVVRHFEAPTIRVKIDTLSEGQAFGWSALVAPYLYKASAICAKKTEEIYFRKEDLFKLFDQVPRVGYVFMKNLAAIISSRLTKYETKLSKDIAIDERDDYEW